MSEDEVILDPELEMDDADDVEEDELSGAFAVIEELQREFVQGVQKVIEPLTEANPEHRGSIEATAEGVLNLIEGNGLDEGYILVKRTEADLAMVPCSREVYQEHLRDFADPTGLDISVGIAAMFNDINS